MYTTSFVSKISRSLFDISERLYELYNQLSSLDLEMSVEFEDEDFSSELADISAEALELISKADTNVSYLRGKLHANTKTICLK